MCTSVDAAFLYRPRPARLSSRSWSGSSPSSYLRLRTANPGYDQSRTDRYSRDFLDPDGPIRSEILDFEWLLDEPFYPLRRQQLLAHRLEQEHVLGTDVVRVLHVLAPQNAGYQDSLPRPEHRALGGSVDGRVIDGSSTRPTSRSTARGRTCTGRSTSTGRS